MTSFLLQNHGRSEAGEMFKQPVKGLRALVCSKATDDEVLSSIRDSGPEALFGIYTFLPTLDGEETLPFKMNNLIPFRIPCSLAYFLIKHRRWDALAEFGRRLEEDLRLGRTQMIHGGFGEFPSLNNPNLTSPALALLQHKKGDLLISLLEIVSPELPLQSIRDPVTGVRLPVLFFCHTPFDEHDPLHSMMLALITERHGGETLNLVEEVVVDEKDEILTSLVASITGNGKLDPSNVLLEKNPTTLRSVLEMILTFELPKTVNYLVQKGFLAKAVFDHKCGAVFHLLLFPEYFPQRNRERLDIITHLLSSGPLENIERPFGTSFFIFPHRGFEIWNPSLECAAGLVVDFCLHGLAPGLFFSLLKGCREFQDKVADEKFTEQLAKLQRGHERLTLEVIFEAFALVGCMKELEALLCHNLAVLLNYPPSKILPPMLSFILKWKGTLCLLINAGFSLDYLYSCDNFLNELSVDILNSLSFRLSSQFPQESYLINARVKQLGYV